MARKCAILVLGVAAANATIAAGPSDPASHRTLFVRQTVGDDAQDGLTPETAWKTLEKLETELRAGDTAYVGPGLYRERLEIPESGTETRTVNLVADPTGRRTGDPPGPVMIAGADPVDESIFRAGPDRGVYTAPSPDASVLGVVEMDGPQFRYQNVLETREVLREGAQPLEVVATMPSSFWFDRDSDLVYLHTSDGKSPSTRELEFIRRDYGIVAYGKRYVSIVGFTFRHMWIAGVNFESGACNGFVVDNVSYGSWQGIRVAGSAEVLIDGNTSFRNGNSGVYFLQKAAHNRAVGNVVYENAQGLRWSSESSHGLAAENVVFANLDTGISLENVDETVLSGNHLARNAVSHLLTKKSRFVSRGNCFHKRNAGRWVARIEYFNDYETLAEYQTTTHQDPGATEHCGRLPRKIDVRRLHRSTMKYPERARKILEKRARRASEKRSRESEE